MVSAMDEGRARPGWRVRLRPYCSGNLPLFLSISRPTQDSRTGIPHPHDLPRTKVHAKGDEKAAASDPTALKMAGGGVVADEDGVSHRCSRQGQAGRAEGEAEGVTVSSQ